MASGPARAAIYSARLFQRDNGGAASPPCLPRLPAATARRHCRRCAGYWSFMRQKPGSGRGSAGRVATDKEPSLRRPERGERLQTDCRKWERYCDLNRKKWGGAAVKLAVKNGERGAPVFMTSFIKISQKKHIHTRISDFTLSANTQCNTLMCA